MDDVDRQLIALLRKDARTNVATLAGRTYREPAWIDPISTAQAARMITDAVRQGAEIRKTLALMYEASLAN